MNYALPILSILGVHLAAVASPGPNFLIVSRNALTCSRQAGLATARGIATAAIVYIGAGMLGFAALVSQSVLIFNMVKALGAIYLIGMGIHALRTGQQTPETPAEPEPSRTMTGQQAYLSGILTSFSNPKAAIYFLALFTTFVPATMPAAIKLLTAVGLLSISITWYSFVAWSFSIGCVRRAYWRFARWWNYAFGGLWIGLGIKLLGVQQP